MIVCIIYMPTIITWIVYFINKKICEEFIVIYWRCKERWHVLPESIYPEKKG